MTATRIVPQDAPTLASDAELAAHAADTTAIHGITDTSTLSLVGHAHAGADITSGTVADARIDAALARDSEVTSAISTHEGLSDPHPGYLTPAEGGAAYEAAGAVATHSADTTSVHGITDTAALVIDGDAAGGELAGTYPNPTVAATHSGSAHHAAVTVGTGLDVTGQLVELDLSEVASGGELGGFMDAPTVDATHSGSTHAAAAAAAVATHEADVTSVHAHTSLSAVGIDDHHARDHAINGAVHTGTLDDAQIPAGIARDSEVTTAVGAEATARDSAIATHAGLADPHTGYRLEAADHDHSATGLQAGTVGHGVLTGVTSDQHHAQLHAATHLPTGTDAVDKFSQSNIGTADLAIANTETVVVSDVFAANELTAGMTFMFRAQATRAGVASASEVIRIRIGTTTLVGNIAATLTPPLSTLAVPVTIEGIVTIRSAGAGGSALGSLERRQHLAAVTITSAINPLTATVAVNTTSANQRVELTFISGSATNTYTFRNAVMYRVA